MAVRISINDSKVHSLRDVKMVDGFNDYRFAEPLISALTRTPMKNALPSGMVGISVAASEEINGSFTQNTEMTGR